ncbi:zinc finger protein 658 isoform X2 [Copidosoma floridanum]|uniref:zinc finger protein 658 isoform X2 n=1 Tax=Copidosoma floridanum TaxID=29053 RepID=UPI0006C9A0A3|nr:zinc finger protein 658 isoform X2 [Copidosoma floridanum]
MPSGSGNKRLSAAKIQCLMKIPVVVLEKLVIKTDKIIANSQGEVKKIKVVKKCTQKMKSKKVVVNLEKKHKGTEKSKSSSKDLPFCANNSLYPKVILERMSINTTKYPCSKKDGTVLEKSTNSYETESSEINLSSINKENLTTNIKNQQSTNEDTLEKKSKKYNLISINQNSTSNATKYRVQAESKEVESCMQQKDKCHTPSKNLLVKFSREMTISNEANNKENKHAIELDNTHKLTNVQNLVDESDDEIDILTIDDETVIEGKPDESVKYNTTDDSFHSNGHLKVVTSKTNSVSKIADSSDMSTENSSDESSTFTDDERNTDSESISEFLTYEGNALKNPRPENQIRKLDQPIDKHNFYISLKDAFESIANDMNHLDEALCTYGASHEDYETRSHVDDDYIEESPLILHVPNRQNDVNIVNNQSERTINYCGYNSASSTLERRLNFVRESQLFNRLNQNNESCNGQTPGGDNLPKRISIRVARCPKCKRVFTDVNFARHWDMCRIGPYIPCVFCDNKFKQKRSLISHMKRHHRNKIHDNDIFRVANNSYLKAKAALAKMKHLPSEMLEIHVPDFVRVYCKMCFTAYTSLPQNYRKICENCSKVLTFHCNRCHTYQLTSHHMAMHLRSECEVIEHSSVLCPDCNYFEARSRRTEQRVVQAQQSLLPSLSVPLVDPEQDIHLCKKCGRELHSRRSLVKHTRHCGRAADLSCKYCTYKTKHRSVIMVHMQQHVINNDQPLVRDDEDVAVVENISQVSFNTVKMPEPSKEEHKRIIDSKIVVYCPKCQHKPGDTLEYRYTTCINCCCPYNFQCSDCNMVYTSYCLVNYHVARQHAPKIFSCDTCPRTYSFEPDFLNHMENCKKMNTLFCDECTYTTRMPRYLLNHQLRRHPKDQDLKYPCTKCSMRFSLEMSLRQHLKHCGLTRRERLACNHCGFTTVSKFSLKRHLQSQHATEIFELQFSCDFCKKKFSNVFCYESHVEKCPTKLLSNSLLP